MPATPANPRAIAFFDGQNLFHAVKAAFGYRFPNFDPGALAGAVCERQGWDLEQVRFYTGAPAAADDAFWHHFWNAKGAQMGRAGIHVHIRPLRYRTKRVRLPGGKDHTFRDGDEKGIDVRIAIDIIRLAHHRSYDVAVVFSQDNDLSEVADEIRAISREQVRWIKIASAFPVSVTARSNRGITKTDWIRIDRDTYDRCIDPRDYRPKR